MLGDLPQKTFTDETRAEASRPLEVPFSSSATEGGGAMEALGRVLRLLQVGSKRFLTNKVQHSIVQYRRPVHLFFYSTTQKINIAHQVLHSQFKWPLLWGGRGGRINSVRGFPGAVF